HIRSRSASSRPRSWRNVMINELLDERSFENIFPDRQRALIAQHCRGIVGLITTAENSDQAEGIVRRACAAFEKECSSTLVRRALSIYLPEKHRENLKRDAD